MALDCIPLPRDNETIFKQGDEGHHFYLLEARLGLVNLVDSLGLGAGVFLSPSCKTR